MLGIPDDIAFGPSLDASWTCVFVKENGKSMKPIQIKIPPGATLSDLLEKAAKLLKLDRAKRAYFSNGQLVQDIEHIEEDEVIHISQGDCFRAGRHNAGNEVLGGYVLHEMLGEGGFGKVMRAVNATTSEIAAIKFVAKSSFRDFSDLQRVFTEIQALRDLKHPNVIRMLDVVDHPENICFIMEYASGGELREYCEKHGPLDEVTSRVFFQQIVKALHYCHSKKIIHRDLKLENILLDEHNRCKIVDFGLSDFVAESNRVVTDAGTEAYLAPEVLRGSSGHHDPFKIDVWALGVILFAMTHKKLPFHSPNVEVCNMLDTTGLQYRSECSTEMKLLIKKMLIPRVSLRHSLNDVSTDPWVTSNRFARCSIVGSMDDAASEAAKIFGLKHITIAEDSEDDTNEKPPSSPKKEKFPVSKAKPKEMSPTNKKISPSSGSVQVSSARGSADKVKSIQPRGGSSSTPAAASSVNKAERAREALSLAKSRAKPAKPTRIGNSR